ncbi:UNVERIFIED_CONTAM: hypothetical protein RMT77_000292 [Armadillidium vulgare]
MNSKYLLFLCCVIPTFLMFSNYLWLSVNKIEKSWKEFETKVLKHISEDSICKSLISINTSYFSDLKESIDFERSLKGFKKSKLGLPSLYNDFISELSKRWPNSYEIKNFHSTTSDGFRFNKKDLLTNITTWPFADCKVHPYTAEDFKTCAVDHKMKTGKPLRISFLGDSVIRYIMEEMVRFSKDILNVRYGNKTEGELDKFLEIFFFDKKFKSNLNLIGKNVEFRLYWAPYLIKNRTKLYNGRMQGARDLLYEWANVLEDNVKDPIPNILYIGTGLWNFKFQPSFEAMSNYIAMIKEIAPFLQKISKRTQIIWHVHPTYYRVGKISSEPWHSILAWMNQLSYLNLGHIKNIWFWDTLAIIMSKEKSNCRKLVNLIKNTLLFPLEFQCHDPCHPGVESRKQGVNLILNVLCNPILRFQDEYCCK